MNMLEKARKIATKAHSSQKRWGGDPYITHPERVAEKVKILGIQTEAVAWLHDVVEDTEVTIEDLRNEGFPQAVLSAVEALTHRGGESYAEYIKRISNNSIASHVKIADLEDNMSDLNPRQKQRKEKYELAKVFLEMMLN